MRTLPLSLALAALAACRSSTAPERPIAVPLALRAIAARTTVASGDTVTVRLTAHNRGTRSVTLDNPQGCHLGLQVQDEGGETYESLVFASVGGVEGLCPSPGNPVTIAPGDSIVHVGRWEAGYVIGGDVFARAKPGTWILHPVALTTNGALPGTLDLPATVSVIAR